MPQCNGHCGKCFWRIFPRAQVKDCHVLMMRMFGEQIQDTFVVAPFIHQIVQDQDSTPVGKPLHQLLVIGNPFVKLDPAIFHGLKSILPSSVTVMNEHGRVVEQLRVVQQKFFGAPQGSHYQNTGRGVKTERSSQHDCPLHTNDTRCIQVYTFLFSFLTTTLMIRGLTHCANPTRYKSTVSLFRQLRDHCLHNHDLKSHSKILAACVHGLFLSSTAMHNCHNCYC